MAVTSNQAAMPLGPWPLNFECCTQSPPMGRVTNSRKSAQLRGHVQLGLRLTVTLRTAWHSAACPSVVHLANIWRRVMEGVTYTPNEPLYPSLKLSDKWTRCDELFDPKHL
ncbi:hypothetical protein AC1031_020443 [Aphanomyces cochlioides]|nr:hypothetical protein AC1031_020443 [Aphanomyces cochlioides]